MLQELWQKTLMAVTQSKILGSTIWYIGSFVDPSISTTKFPAVIGGEVRSWRSPYHRFTTLSEQVNGQPALEYVWDRE